MLLIDHYYLLSYELLQHEKLILSTYIMSQTYNGNN